MLKLLGGLLVLSGGGAVWVLRWRERHHQRETMAELLRTLRQMGEEIRMARTPLPRLLASLAANCGTEASELFLAASAAAAGGEDLMGVWRREAERLPLAPRDREALRALDLRGDAEHLGGELAIALRRLADSLDELERRHPEEDKRTAALCFSAAALLVILLI